MQPQTWKQGEFRTFRTTREVYVTLPPIGNSPAREKLAQGLEFEFDGHTLRIGSDEYERAPAALPSVIKAGWARELGSGSDGDVAANAAAVLAELDSSTASMPVTAHQTTPLATKGLSDLHADFRRMAAEAGTLREASKAQDSFSRPVIQNHMEVARIASAPPAPERPQRLLPSQKYQISNQHEEVAVVTPSRPFSEPTNSQVTLSAKGEKVTARTKTANTGKFTPGPIVESGDGHVLSTLAADGPTPFEGGVVEQNGTAAVLAEARRLVPDFDWDFDDELSTKIQLALENPTWIPAILKVESQDVIAAIRAAAAEKLA